MPDLDWQGKTQIQRRIQIWEIAESETRSPGSCPRQNPDHATQRHEKPQMNLTPPAPAMGIYAKAFELLDRLGIPHTTLEHPPLHTVEESQALRGEIAGGHTKNLFVKDKGGRFFLITAQEDSPLDLKTIDKAIGARGRVSFASAEQLMAHLGILPGSVSPLALVNDTAGAVQFILEKRLLDHTEINVHPLINTLTTTIPTPGLLAYIRASGHEPAILDLPLRAPAEPAGE